MPRGEFADLGVRLEGWNFDVAVGIVGRDFKFNSGFHFHLVLVHIHLGFPSMTYDFTRMVASLPPQMGDAII